jgi:serine/threonine protein kinase/tetratricopeptide (TPR) repeat protein
MGEVWRAWDERLERWVALKQIRADVTLRHGRERLWREARAAARLNHPSIVHVYDIVEGEDGDWIVMELVEGKTVRHLLDEETAFPPARAAKLCREIAEGLAEAHAQGILHRDLKARNVIVAPSGRAKILDFGLAKAMPREGAPENQELSISGPGAMMGTCYAMSPEQALGRSLDERSDLFSLGSLLYEMLTGDAPFRAETAALSVARVVEYRQPPLQRTHPQIPPGICELVDWLLQKRPQDRPQSAAEVLAILEAAADPAQRVEPPRRPAPPRLDETTAATLVESPRQPVPRPTRDDTPRQSSGERRTVTIVCCALIQLDRPAGRAGALDVEVLSDATIAFESLGREICHDLLGSLVAVLNRTLWLCFGYPRAHEDDAERAVRAAREIQARFAALPAAAAHRLAVRAGLHTGPAVVVIRSSEGQTLQPGDTFDIALAIQSQVPAGGIGVSAASRQLLARKFATQPLPAVHLKDLDATVDVYELGAPLEHESLEEGPALPLVNRDAEMQILLDRFRLARSGSGQAVLIAGEAGIGKSRLVRELDERLTEEAPDWLIAQGSAYARNTPLSPLLPLLSRSVFTLADSPEGSTEEKLRRLEEVLDEHGLPLPDHAPLLGELLSLPVEERYPPLSLTPEARRKRTLASLVALLGAMAERHPVVLAVEDLHWIDPSTLELLDLLLGEISRLPLLLVATFRPDFTAPWRHQTLVTQLNLGGLNEAHAAQLIERVAEGQRLPVEARREIVARTDGIPLFVEELTKAVLEAEAPPAEPSGVPFTLGSSLLARLDRLGDAKAVAQLAAVIGRTFTVEQLEALSWIKGAVLREALGRLLQAEILRRRGPAHGARYTFKHALIQDAAYLSLLASDRQQLHRRLARLLQEDFPAMAEPELMAHHCERGGLTEEAADYLLQAGQAAWQRSAALEAVSHLTRALDLLLALPATPERLERELNLRSLLALALGAVQGWGAPEVGANAERCVALCREIGEGAPLLASLYGLWTCHFLRGDRQPTIGLADEIARLATTPTQVYVSHAVRTQVAYHRGLFAEALAWSEQAIALFEPGMLPELEDFGLESSFMPYVYQAWTLWCIGEPDRALRQRDAMLSLVEPLGSPHLLGVALICEVTLLHDLRVPDPEQVEATAERLLKLAQEQEIPVAYAIAQLGRGWAVCQRGDLAGGTALIQAGLNLYAATGSRLGWGYWSCYLIEAYLAAGRIAEGLAATREALLLSETQLDVNDDAELLRLEGELLRASGDVQAAEASFQKALGVAREQGARAFELRATVSLGRLLEEEGRRDEALPPLAAVYKVFREGFETRDLTEARELLGRLERLAPQQPAS